MRGAINHTVKERDERGQVDVATHQTVDVGGYRLRCDMGFGKCTNRGLEVRHDEGRGKPFSSNIGNGNTHRSISKTKSVVAVASKRRGRLPCSSDITSMKRRKGRRQEGSLNDPGILVLAPRERIGTAHLESLFNLAFDRPCERRVVPWLVHERSRPKPHGFNTGIDAPPPSHDNARQDAI